MAAAGDVGALASLMCLDGNMRSAEVLNRTVRDIDPTGRRLLIVDGKTEDSDRDVTFSDELAGLLAKHIEGRDPNEPLIPAGRDGKRKDRKTWLRDQCVRLCKEAGVPRVTPHGLRGTGSQTTLMRMVMGVVQATMGHAPGTSVTKDHYVGAQVYAEAERLLARATRAN